VIHIAVTEADKPCNAVCAEQLHALHSIQVSHTHVSACLTDWTCMLPCVNLWRPRTLASHCLERYRLLSK